ncbi:hypothetical protein B0H17DRAFT_190883 [Mycena rosella]|uniref:Uncharacterized protein n=1 Tax=Mycena rosella TaxID=1033263 RepID=A0AAD7D0A8_MYCRO|nr:hypothetical protein B0H17DRAFT_190883 [Mycena rosella]
MEAWRPRTNGRPISLTLRSMHRQLSPQLLSYIPSFSSQLCRLELELNPLDYQYLRAKSVAFPVLRELAVCCYRPNDEDFAVIFKTAPALRTLRILTDPRPFLPFGQYPMLQSLELCDISVPALLDALAEFPRLAHLKASLGRPITVTGLESNISIAPNLESLVIGTYCGYPTPGDTLLDWLTLPNLRSLELHNNPQFDALSSFFTRSSCQLEHLALAIESKEDMQELPRIWLKTYSITTLEIYVEEHILEFMQTLTLQVHKHPDGFLQPVLLPHIKTLTVATWNLDFDYEMLFLYLRDSMNLERHPTRLESFHLKLTHDPTGNDRIFWLPDDQVLSEFERLVAEGLDIKITSPDDHLNWPDELNFEAEGKTFL